MVRCKRYFVLTLIVVFALSCVLFAAACVRSFFTPDWIGWFESCSKPSTQVRQIVMFSSRGGLGLYYSRTTFPDATPRLGSLSWSHDKGHISTNYPSDQNADGSGLILPGIRMAHHVRGPLEAELGGEFPRRVLLSLSTSSYVFIVPYPVLIILLLLPVLFLVHIYRRQKRFASGLCAVCGYDLRASPVRCPECGTAVAKSGVREVR